MYMTSSREIGGQATRFVRSHIRFAAFSFLLAGLCGSLAVPTAARAQTKDATAGKESAPDSVQEIAALSAALDDLGELRVLNPLKLTPEELDAVSKAVADSQADYNKKLAALGPLSIGKVAENIRNAKKQALAGKVLASDDTILKAMTDYAAKHKELDDATLKSLSDKLQTLLTEAQIKAAAKIARDEQAKLGGSTAKGTDAQWFNLYVLRVVIGYSRIVPLLKEMKAAQSGSAGSTPAATKAP